MSEQKGLYKILTYAKNQIRPIRHNIHLFTTDAYGISYPKTGTTWLRYTLGKYIQSICKSKAIILYDRYSMWGKCQKACVGPAMNFTHAPLEFRTQTSSDIHYGNVLAPYTNKQVVLIARYPLDALVSHWHHAKYKTFVFDGSLEDFIESDIFGIEKCLKFYNLWAENHHNHSILLLRYEDLKTDTKCHLIRLLKFLDINVYVDLVQKAVEAGSFSNMQKLELSGTAPKYKYNETNIFGPTNKQNPNSYHVRKGKVGGFCEYLSARDSNHYTERISNELHPWYEY